MVQERIRAQRAVNQRAVRGGKSLTRTGKRRTARQSRVQKRSVPEMRWIGRDSGRDYYRTVKRRK